MLVFDLHKQSGPGGSQLWSFGNHNPSSMGRFPRLPLSCTNFKLRRKYVRYVVLVCRTSVAAIYICMYVDGCIVLSCGGGIVE